jgi:hypothetical protein
LQGWALPEALQQRGCKWAGNESGGAGDDETTLLDGLAMYRPPAAALWRNLALLLEDDFGDPDEPEEYRVP